jgi:hypothetical protein
MVAKKTATKKTEPKEPVFAEAEAVPEPETYEIRYDSNLQDREFYEPGIRYNRNPNTGRQEKEQVIPAIRIRSGQTVKLTKEQFEYLDGKNLILDAERKADRDKVKKDLLKIKSGREEPKQEMQVIPDSDKLKIFIDLPYRV